MTTALATPRPFVKWVGGKRQLAGWHIESVSRRGTISSKGSRRGRVGETLVTARKAGE